MKNNNFFDAEGFLTLLVTSRSKSFFNDTTLVVRDDSQSPEFYFSQREVREAIYTVCKDTVEYIRKEKIANVFFVERAARTAWIGLHTYWQKHYAEEKEPGYYFINPSMLTPTRFCKRMFEESFGMVFDKTKPTLVFDSCIHTGNTLGTVAGFLLFIGFLDPRLVVATGIPDRCILLHDNSIGENLGLLNYSCSLFGGYHLTTKGSKMAPVRLIGNNRKDGTTARQLIKEIILEGL